MGRSNNRHVAAELAAALGMHYAFGVSYLVLGDDFLENPEGKPNTLALAGAAILSRFPIGRVDNVDLPELRDKFSSRREKRLGKKRALLCELKLPDGPLLCAACHLDSNASPRQRADQLEALLARASALADSGHGDSGRAVGHPLPILIGGDLNTTTYDASGPLSLFLDLLHKFLFTGFNQTVEGYMQPELGYDRPLFDVLTRHGFAIEGFNERGHGTYFYDVMSPYAVQKLYSKVGRWPTHWLQRRLRPWNGVVPARLDWFAGRGLNPVGCEVVAVQGQDGLPLSDHSPIVVDIVPSEGLAAREGEDRLEQAVLGEAVIAAAGHHDVIEQRDTQEVPGLRQPQGELLVFGARARLAAWVVVRHQRRGHPLAEQRPEHIGGAHQHAIDLPQGGDVTAADAVARVESEDVHRLLLALGQLDL